MARYTFPGDLFLYEGSNNAVLLGADAAFRVWTARTGGTDITASMTQSDGVTALPVNGSGDILADSDGQRPWMKGPDGVVIIYVAAGVDRYPVAGVEPLQDALLANPSSAFTEDAVDPGFYIPVGGTGGGGSPGVFKPVGADGNGLFPTRVEKRLAGGVFNVKGYGAKGDGVTDDTAAIQAAITALQASGNRGCIYFPGNTTYLVSSPITIYSDIDYVGDGVGATRIKLKASSNCDVFRTDQFSTYTTGTSQNGPVRWSIRNLRVDGNGANQASGSWCLRSYASNFIIQNVHFVDGKSGCVWSEWGTSGTDMESFWVNVKIRAPGSSTSSGKGLDFQGPHDSVFANLIVNSADGQNGIYVHGNAGGDQFLNAHVWGTNDVNWKIEKPARIYGGVAEGATTQNVLWLTNKGTWHGEIFGTNGTNPTEIGFQLGDATHTSLIGNNIDITTHNWGAGSTPFVTATNADGGNLIRVVGPKGGATNFRSASINANSHATFLCTDTASQSTAFAGTGLRNFNALINSIAADGANGTAFRVNTNSNPHSVQVAASSQLQGYIGAFATETFRLDAAIGAIQPGTPTGRGGKIYSGSGAPGTITGSAAGDFYFRTDTPTTANQRIYVATAANTWTGIV